MKSPLTSDTSKTASAAPQRARTLLLAVNVGGVLLMLAAGAAFFWFSVQPIINLQARLDQQQRQLLDRRTQARQAHAKVQQGRTALDAARRDLQQSNLRLAPAAATDEKIRVLSDLAAKSGLKTEEVLPAEPTYSAFYGSVPIHLTGNGSYASWGRFVHLLASEHPDVSIDDFQLEGKPETPGLAMDFAVDLTWFVSPQTVAAK